MTNTNKATDKATERRFVFNKSNLDKIPFAEKGVQESYYDTRTPGFGLRVGATSKTYILYARVKNGAPVRLTLGKYGVMSLDEARDKAIQELNNLNQGINPIQKRQEKKAAEKLVEKKDTETVQWLLDKYKQERIIAKDKKNQKGSEGTLRSLKDTELYFGKRVVTTLKFNEKTKQWVVDKEGVVLEDMLSRPYRSITAKEILERFKVFSKAKPARCGKVLRPIGRTHQVAFRMLRSAYNHEIPIASFYNPEDAITNPLNILKTFKLWEETNARKNYLDWDKLEFVNWWNATTKYSYCDNLVSDYLFLSLLQNGRSIDIAPLEWTQVDFQKRVIYYDQTKNKEAYLFPITDMAMEILLRRKEIVGKGKYVFGYKGSKSGYVSQDCKHHFKVIGKTSGKLISHHDLRRTFASAARVLGIDSRVLEYCQKHTIGDVNEHYFMKEEPAIRAAFQAVENFFIEKVKEGQAKLDELNEQRLMQLVGIDK